jgi:hypothetical protein
VRWSRPNAKRTLAVLALGSVLTTGAAGAQQVDSTASMPQAPLLSPAYDRASLPVEITRRDVNNWSEVETAALSVAVAQAKEACVARQSEVYAGSDLVAYARLCALGKQWQPTFVAATTYINSKDAAKPLLADAYAFEVQADLNLGNETAAVRTCFAMLKSVPYGPTTDDVTTATVRYLQFAYLPDALDLLFQRQPYLLGLMRHAAAVAGGLPQAAGASSAATAPAIPIPTLYQHALSLPAMQQYNAQPERAVEEMTEIEDAMPSTLTPDEAILVASARQQYELLGTHFPELAGSVSLISATENAPGKVRLGEATVFLLFPPWCAQCVRQAKEMVPALFRDAMVSGSDARLHLYGLMADRPPTAIGSAAAKPARPAKALPRTTAAETSSAVRLTSDKAGVADVVAALRKTPTLVVAPAVLEEFGASDFPFLIAVDHDGIIRLMVPAAPSNALQQNGPVDQIADTIRQHWPVKTEGKERDEVKK